jgi:1,4-dihydroxy-2-naphthoyl-CoA hydrolase
MAIWFRPYGLDEVNARGRGTMMEHVGIALTGLGEDWLAGTMPVDARTRQPAGILHGGASVVLAESLASTAGNLVVDPSREYGVGLEINANHVRSVAQGVVHGITRPLHLGRTTQVWETRITEGDDGAGRLVCVSRMTLAVLKKRGSGD